MPKGKCFVEITQESQTGNHHLSSVVLENSLREIPTLLVEILLFFRRTVSAFLHLLELLSVLLCLFFLACNTTFQDTERESRQRCLIVHKVHGFEWICLLFVTAYFLSLFYLGNTAFPSAIVPVSAQESLSRIKYQVCVVWESSDCDELSGYG